MMASNLENVELRNVRNVVKTLNEKGRKEELNSYSKGRILRHFVA